MSLQIFPYFPKKNPPEVIQYPDKRLRLVCKKVTKFDKGVEKIAQDLVSILKKIDQPIYIWLGMASNQLGYDKRVIALKKSLHDYTIMVNPEIIESKWRFPSVSTCFSFKGLYLLKKYYWIRVKYQDLTGKHYEELLKGGRASVFQQEIDHINGVLVCD